MQFGEVLWKYMTSSYFDLNFYKIPSHEIEYLTAK